ncbi:PAS domain S-box family protein [Ichthyophthirius multifiliis]|uniref:PAS domain S-box family protein n=1 Tax=Ichthyophthirius multifiliis TaxID=5932 RepID=G0QX26_ICHMU|nr:PAS domain S-box family protein [Ichthyophthirius multifiliis]EGR30230.1 PAS domain S-box family protein [Ichthyophthirius multifiliis]|eukprot:XP_004031826.1 PAS domain S-box family protein [Ichthyophthirius multifiliis]
MQYVYMRSNLLSDINFYTRKLWLLGNGYIQAHNNNSLLDIENFYKTQLEKYVKNLQDVQFNVIKADIKMQNRMKEPPDNQPYQFYSKKQNNETSVEYKSFTDAIFQYITSASTLKSAQLINFIPQLQNNNQQVSIIEPTQIYYFIVRQNGLFLFRQSCEEISENFFNFYYNLVQDSDLQFLIIMIIGILFFILSQFILIPIVFQVIKTNNRVLSLFGYIPIVEIKYLSYKCDKFIQLFIKQENYQQEQNMQQQQQKHLNSKSNSLSKQYEINSVKNRMIKNHSPQQIIQNFNNSQLKIPPGNPNYKSLMNTPSKKNIEDDEKMQLKDNIQNKDEEKKKQLQKQYQEKAAAVAAAAATSKLIKGDEDFENFRSEKFLNQKAGKQKIIFFSFSFISFLFIIFFIISYALQKDFLRSINKIQEHLKYILERPSLLKFNLLFTLEEIVEGIPIQYENQDLRKFYANQIHENQKQVYFSFKGGFSYTFQDYEKYFNLIDDEEICDNVSLISNISECKLILNGILQRGLRTSIVSLTETLRDISVKFSDSINKQKEFKIQCINNEEFISLEKGMQYIVTSIYQLNDFFLYNIDIYLKFRLKFEIILFSIFISIFLLIFSFVWIPYLSGLSIKIWRTKGMLNMIPINIITKYDTLKQALFKVIFQRLLSDLYIYLYIFNLSYFSFFFIYLIKIKYIILFLALNFIYILYYKNQFHKIQIMMFSIYIQNIYQYILFIQYFILYKNQFKILFYILIKIQLIFTYIQHFYIYFFIIIIFQIKIYYFFILSFIYILMNFFFQYLNFYFQLNIYEFELFHKNKQFYKN